MHLSESFDALALPVVNELPSGPSFSHSPWLTHSSEQKYRNRWLALTEHQVTNPAGKPGIYGVVEFQQIAIGIVPLHSDGTTWLVGQYRYTLSQYSWEIPEGGGPMNEDPLLAAQRELREETGLVAARWDHFMDLHLSNSVTDEYSRAYLARELSPGPPEPEDTERLTVLRVPFETAIAMALDGRITDGLSVAALLKAEYLLSRGLL
jgi:8-oxo-dGTP pyrophosphatase MutT (NUDIX family)